MMVTEQAFETILRRYYAAHKQLFSLVTDPEGNRVFAEKTAEIRRHEHEMQLRRTADFLQYAGHPERQFNGVQIAGTSGKGSVTYMVAALLQMLGWRTGHHTSPYLQTPAEKLVVDDKWIRPSAFAELVQNFWSLYQSWSESGREFDRLRYGEAWVALTLYFMEQHKVEWGVIETGLGGRFDPVTLMPAKLAILTNVGWDHEKSLGPALTDIAWHKAGIIKEGQDVVTAVREPELLAVVKREAAEKNATVFAIGESFNYTVEDDTLTIQAPFQTYTDVPLSLGRGYQVENGAVAIAAADVLAERYGKQLTTALISQALQMVTMPGRMEIMQREPLVIIDGAHNQPKMSALVNTIREQYPDKKVTVILGVLLTKNSQRMLEMVLPIASKIIATQPRVPGKRPLPAADLAKGIKQMGDVVVQTADNVREALELALEQATADELILTTGSLYLIGEARAYWYPTEQLLYNSELG